MKHRPRCRSAYVVPVVAFLPVWVFLCAGNASALPWDRDLNRQQSYQANELPRTPPIGSVPVGRQPFAMTLDEAEKNLENPVPLTDDSLWRGRRMYSANCLPCHGAMGDGKGPVGLLMGVPDLRADIYRERTDGRIYWVIHHGIGNMPRYGYKFAPNEQWDVVNYLRFLQGQTFPDGGRATE